MASTPPKHADRWLFSRVKYNQYLTNLSGTLRPAAYEDKAPSFRRNLLYILSIFIFFVVAGLILFYQLSERPIMIETIPISMNLDFVNGIQTKPMWDESVSQWILEQLWNSDNGGDETDCNCYGQNFKYDEQQYPYFHPSELSTCLRLVHNKYEPLCRYLDEQVRVTFQTAMLYTVPTLMTPLRWQLYISNAYFTMCASLVVQLSYSESIHTVLHESKYGGSPPLLNDTEIDSWITDEEFKNFTAALLEDTKSIDGYMCDGYTFGHPDHPDEPVWQFDALLPSPWPAAVDRLIPPARVRNHKADGTVMDTSVYEAYLALYCNPTVCETFSRMSIWTVLINTAGTIATVFSGLMLISALCYAISRAAPRTRMRRPHQVEAEEVPVFTAVSPPASPGIPSQLSSPMPGFEHVASLPPNPPKQMRINLPEMKHALASIDPVDSDVDAASQGKGPRRPKRKPNEPKESHRQSVGGGAGTRLRIIQDPTGASHGPDNVREEPRARAAGASTDLNNDLHLEVHEHN